MMVVVTVALTVAMVTGAPRNATEKGLKKSAIRMSDVNAEAQKQGIDLVSIRTVKQYYLKEFITRITTLWYLIKSKKKLFVVSLLENIFFPHDGKRLASQTGLFYCSHHFWERLSSTTT